MLLIAKLEDAVNPAEKNVSAGNPDTTQDAVTAQAAMTVIILR